MMRCSQLSGKPRRRVYRFRRDYCGHYPNFPYHSLSFGVSSGLSISKLFMAGIAPGIMMGVTLDGYLVVAGKKRLNLPCQPKFTARSLATFSFRYLGALLPIIIIGGFRSGLFTPTEAGAVAAFYALFVSVVVYREMTFSTLYHVLINAAKTTSVVMFLVASAAVYLHGLLRSPNYP